jgi:porphobilinogen deaminase
VPSNDKTILIATRGSALALAQANAVADQCRAAFPKLNFELNILKTTGDKLQTASMAQEGKSLPKGLFTKELEVALIEKEADLAVHSLKDLPTELPSGLTLGAVGKRADVRDVLIYRDADYLRAEERQESSPGTLPGKPERRGFKKHSGIKDLPVGAVVATSSTRRRAQLLAQNPGLKVPEIRGNVATRLQKLAANAELDATILALAGLTRLDFTITSKGRLAGGGGPQGLLATILETEVMLPCVGQGALGIEIREGDERMARICEQLNHRETQYAVIAERAFLAAMGGGCQSPVAAYAEVVDDRVKMRVLSFLGETMRTGEGSCPMAEAMELGKRLAEELQ